MTSYTRGRGLRSQGQTGDEVQGRAAIISAISSTRSRPATPKCCIADILEGHLSCAHSHLANISYYLGKPASVAEIKHAAGRAEDPRRRGRLPGADAQAPGGQRRGPGQDAHGAGPDAEDRLGRARRSSTIAQACGHVDAQVSRAVHRAQGGPGVSDGAISFQCLVSRALNLNTEY